MGSPAGSVLRKHGQKPDSRRMSSAICLTPVLSSWGYSHRREPLPGPCWYLIMHRWGSVSATSLRLGNEILLVILGWASVSFPSALPLSLLHFPPSPPSFSFFLFPSLSSSSLLHLPKPYCLLGSRAIAAGLLKRAIESFKSPFPAISKPIKAV